MNTNDDRQIYSIHAVPRCVSQLEKCLNEAELFNNILLGDSLPELKINGVITKFAGSTHQELASSDHYTSNEFYSAGGFVSDSGVLTIVSARTSDNEFIWLTTLFQKQEECAFSTLLGRPHPAYRQLLTGSDFKSVVSLFGRAYLTSYHPILERGSVIGISFVGLRLNEVMGDLFSSLGFIVWNDTGHTIVLDWAEEANTRYLPPP